MSEDPFDDLDEYDDREGDPFADLGDEDAASDDADADDAGDGTRTDPDPFAHLDDAAPGVPERPDPADDADESGAGRSARDPDGEPGVDETASGRSQDVDVAGDPFGDVDVSRGDAFADADSPFRQVDVEAADPDEVWDRLVGEGEADRAAGTARAATDEDDVVVVSKHRFCETCPHFTAPPETRCTHAGTEILEFVGPDDVRVANCPVVRERRELGEVHE